MRSEMKTKDEPQAGRRRLDQLVRKNIPLILAALWDAAEWQDSINSRNTAVAKKADRQRARYMKLADAIRGANPTGQTRPTDGGK